MPASAHDSPLSTTIAHAAPSAMVSGMPTVSKRMGRLRPAFSSDGLIRLASVKSNITRPSSAIRSNTSRSTTSSRATSGSRIVAAPAHVNSIGAVMTVRCSRCETRL